VSDPYIPIIGLILTMLITHFVIVRGVKDGIEVASKILMPLLLLTVILLVICSFTLPGAKEGLTFFLRPDFSLISPKVVLSAMGQAFFSLSLGMGCLCTYASYFKNDTNLTSTAVSVAAMDTIVAVMAGLIIFPAVYSVPGIHPDEGASLAFVTLPKVFQIAFHNVPWLAYISAILFYLLLALAAITSTISLHEVSTAYFHETYHLSRRKAAWIVTIGCTIIGVFCSLSFGVLNGVHIFGLTIFDFFDFITAKLMLPIGGMFIAIFTGWVLKRSMVKEELTNNGTLRMRIFGFYMFIIRYIAPVAIALIFINEMLFK
jgi:NSS family neurotransmitter:Na+ symporter